MPQQHPHPTQHDKNHSSEDELRSTHVSTPSVDTDSEIEIDMSMSREELYKNARKAQSKANTAISEAKAARRKAAETIVAAEGQPSPAKRPKITTSDVEENVKNIEHYGRKFLITNLLWLHGNTKTAFEADIDEDYEDFERFENMETMIQGQLRDICEVLPEKYYNDLSSSWLRRAFLAGMQSQRSNISTRVRTRCGPMIFSCTEAEIKSTTYRQDHFSTQIGRTKNDGGEWYYDTWHVEFLHINWQGKRDINTIFLNPKLMMVISGIIRGPASVVSMSEGRGSTSSRNNETLDVKWGLDHTTPGMIAAGAILARWAVSVDTLLTDQGAQTGVRWRDDFEDYLKYLLNGLRLRKASVLKIFREWDNALFPFSSSGIGGRHAHNDRDSNMKTMLDALEDDIEGEQGEHNDINESQQPEVRHRSKEGDVVRRGFQDEDDDL